MTSRRRIIAIPGSMSQRSVNLSLIRSIIQIFSDRLDIKVFEGLADIPLFNPDLDTENPPENVSNFRRQLKQADAILICTPEYAMGVPGTLKNAIDWTVSSMEFSHKPVALITASTAGQKGHQSLINTLKIIEAHMPDDSQLLISHVRTKVKADKIIDPETLQQIKKLIGSMTNSIVMARA